MITYSLKMTLLIIHLVLSGYVSKIPSKVLKKEDSTGLNVYNICENDYT